MLIHKSPRLIRIQRKMNPAHTTPFYLTKIHLNITIASMCGLESRFFLPDFPMRALHAVFFFPNETATRVQVLLTHCIVHTNEDKGSS
jgi:hypothetical protein